MVQYREARVKKEDMEEKVGGESQGGEKDWMHLCLWDNKQSEQDTVAFKKYSSTSFID